MATITTITTTNPLRELTKYGQSAWLDYIRRNLITSGELKSLVDHDGLGGVTSNPAIFEKAIKGSTDYAEALVELQLTCDDKADLPVPGQKFAFGVVKAAQARGDFQILAERKRRALRVHLHDVQSGLAALQSAIAKSL
jgi:hypothetical protein